jgi:DNA-binding PadR family transcriptional regulator
VTQGQLPEPESFLPLHPLEFRILLSLLDGVAHAYRIVSQIEESRPVMPTNLYRRIWRLASLELIAEVEAPRGETSPRPRRYFELTSLGRRVAAAEQTRLRALLLEAERAGLAQ